MNSETSMIENTHHSLVNNNNVVAIFIDLVNNNQPLRLPY